MTSPAAWVNLKPEEQKLEDGLLPDGRCQPKPYRSHLPVGVRTGYFWRTEIFPVPPITKNRWDVPPLNLDVLGPSLRDLGPSQLRDWLTVTAPRLADRDWPLGLRLGVGAQAQLTSGSHGASYRHDAASAVA